MSERELNLLIVVIDLHGGCGAFCRTLGSGLRRYYPGEVDVQLLILRNRGLLPSDSGAFSRVHVMHDSVWSDWRRVFQPILHTLRFRREIRRLAPGVVLTVGTYANLLVPVAVPDRPTILTVHSNTSQMLAGSASGGVIGRLVRSRFPRSPVICPSSGVADDLRERFGVRQPIVIPHGVDQDRLHALAGQSVADIPASRPYLVACGRLTAAKDYSTLLSAYARARLGGLRDPLVIVGGGEEEAALRAQAQQLGVADDVHFIGHRDNPYPYMKSAKLLVLSSAWEGFGLVLVEAMMLGLPVLSTDCPSGPGEILGGGEFGVLVAPRNPDALADALLKLAASPQRLAFFAERSRHRSEEYRLETMATRYRDLFVRVRDHRG